MTAGRNWLFRRKEPFSATRLSGGDGLDLVLWTAQKSVLICLVVRRRERMQSVERVL